MGEQAVLLAASLLENNGPRDLVTTGGAPPQRLAIPKAPRCAIAHAGEFFKFFLFIIHPPKKAAGCVSAARIGTGDGVGARKAEKSPIDGFFSRSNKKGRTIEFAYSTGKYNDSLTQIIANKPSGKSRSRRRSRTRSRR